MQVVGQVVHAAPPLVEEEGSRIVRVPVQVLFGGGPGSLQGDGVNRVQARYEFGGTATVSNVATARVQVLRVERITCLRNARDCEPRERPRGVALP